MENHAITKEIATKFLSNVPENSKFWCTDGSVFSSLKQLRNALPNMKAETFSYHVNESKNDFSNWIHDAIGDTELASELKKTTDKRAIEKRIRERVKKLQKI